MMIVPMDNGTIWRSADGGATLAQASIPIASAGSRPQHAVRLPNGVLYMAFAPTGSDLDLFDSHSGTAITVNAYTLGETSVVYDSRYEVYRSGDDGQTWQDTGLQTVSGISVAGNQVQLDWGGWWFGNRTDVQNITYYWTDPGMGYPWSSISVATSGGDINDGSSPTTYMNLSEAFRTGGSPVDNFAGSSLVTGLDIESDSSKRVANAQGMVVASFYSAGPCGGSGWNRYTWEGWLTGTSALYQVGSWESFGACNGFDTGAQPARGGSVTAWDNSSSGLVLMMSPSNGYQYSQFFGLMNSSGSIVGPGGNDYFGYQHSVSGTNGFFATTWDNEVYTSNDSGADFQEITTTLPGPVDTAGSFPFVGGRILLANLNSAKYADSRLIALTQDTAGGTAKGTTRLWVYTDAPSAPAIQMTDNGTIRQSGNSVCPGDGIVFSITSSSSDNEGDDIAYQWQFSTDNVNWSGRQWGSSYSVTMAAATAGFYRVVAYSTLDGSPLTYTGSASIQVKLAVVAGFSSIPAATTACPGGAQISLTYTVSGPANAPVSFYINEYDPNTNTNAALSTSYYTTNSTLNAAGYYTLNVAFPAGHFKNTANNGYTTNYVYNVTCSVVGGCGTAYSGPLNVTVLPSVNALVALASSSVGCASKGYQVQVNRLVIAPGSSSVSYYLDAGGGNTYQLVLPDSSSSELVPASPGILPNGSGENGIGSGPMTLTGDLSSGITTTTILTVNVAVQNSCSGGSTVFVGPSVILTPPAQWDAQPQTIGSPGVSGFQGTNNITASMKLGTQPVTWSWVLGTSLNASTGQMLDPLALTTAGPVWAGTILSAVSGDGVTTAASTSVSPGYFAPAASLIPNGSFENGVSSVTLNGVTGLVASWGIGATTQLSTTGAGSKTVSHGSHSLKVPSSGLIRLNNDPSTYIEVDADPADTAPGGQTVQSQTTGWVLLGCFAPGSGMPSYQWMAECYDANRNLLPSPNNLVSLGPSYTPVYSSGEWQVTGFLVTPPASTTGLALPVGTAFWRPVVNVNTNGGSLLVDDLRAFPVSASEQNLQGAINQSAVVAPLIETLFWVDNAGSNNGTMRVRRYYDVAPTEISSCGSNPAVSAAVSVTSESRLVILTSPWGSDGSAVPTLDLQDTTYSPNGEWSLAACQGDTSALLTVQASGGGPNINYQWWRAAASGTWIPVANGTSASFQPSAQVVGTTYYQCEVSMAHDDGSMEDKLSKTIKVVVAPALTGVSVSPVGGTVLFADANSIIASPLVATATPAGEQVNFQWQSSPHSGSLSWSNVSGATGATFTPAPQAGASNNISGTYYQVVASSAYYPHHRPGWLKDLPACPGRSAPRF
jgi:hypothetical protein